MVKRRGNGENVKPIKLEGASTLWLAAWVGHELVGSAPHQCRLQARLERRCCIACVRSPTWRHESSALVISKW